jgi:lysophospholipase L1-like esterase
MSAHLPESPIKVTFFGDSICVGQGVSIYRGWVTRIAGDLDQMLPETGRDVLVTNASVNGRTTRQALEDMPYAVQSHGVDIMIVQFGLNDCNYWQTDNGLPRVSPKGFAANIEEIVSRGITFGARRVFLNNNHPTTRSAQVLPNTKITFDDSNRAYNDIIRKVAAAFGPEVVFTDIERHFQERIGKGADPASFVIADGLHLSAAGHEVYYELMAPIIRRAVIECSGTEGGRPK